MLLFCPHCDDIIEILGEPPRPLPECEHCRAALESCDSQPGEMDSDDAANTWTSHKGVQPYRATFTPLPGAERKRRNIPQADRGPTAFQLQFDGIFGSRSGQEG
jgi:hypothetical protein